jgi:hypothetical protein
LLAKLPFLPKEGGGEEEVARKKAKAEIHHSAQLH